MSDHDQYFLSSAERHAALWRELGLHDELHPLPVWSITEPCPWVLHQLHILQQTEKGETQSIATMILMG